MVQGLGLQQPGLKHDPQWFRRAVFYEVLIRGFGDSTDEIGMGDKIWLEDRDAGFSTADPGKLYLPVVSSLVYHDNNVNVEAQMASSSSLLHWVRGMLQVRARYPVFGLGDFAVCPADNEAVLAYTRSVADDEVADQGVQTRDVLCVNNLSSRPQASTVQLAERFARATVRDLFGGSGFGDVADDGTLTLTMGSRDFFWLALDTASGGD